jgi:hypothetical protein
MIKGTIQGTKALSLRFKQIVKDIDLDKATALAATKIKENIQRRTNRGVDYKGKTFKPYSKKYKAVREAAGRQTAKVDLQFNRHMLNSMTVARKGGGVAHITFSRAEERKKAIFIHEEGGREFFGVSRDDRADARKIFVDMIRRAAK